VTINGNLETIMFEAHEKKAFCRFRRQDKKYNQKYFKNVEFHTADMATRKIIMFEESEQDAEINRVAHN
jgi:predicted RNase H-like nuclease